ncbi:MAG: hypothetical protein QW572_06550 [Candidatus Nitrosocaldus sp.]
MIRLILKGIVGLTLLPFISANITHTYAHLYGGNRWPNTTVDICYGSYSKPDGIDEQEFIQKIVESRHK